MQSKLNWLIAVTKAVLIITVMATSTWAGSSPEWSQDMRLTYTGAQEGFHTLVVDHDDNVYLSWASNYRGSGWFANRKFTKLDRDGNMLIQPSLLPAYSYWAQGPAYFAVDSQNNIHVALHSNEDFYHRVIDPFGNLSGPSKMNKTTGFNTDLPRLLMDGNDRLHLLFQDEQNDPRQGDWNRRRDVFYQRLFWDAGELNYEVGPVEVTIAGGAGYPYVGYVGHMSGATLDKDGNVHAVWSDWRQTTHEVFYSKLSAEGLILIPETRLTANDGKNSASPQIVCDSDNNLHVIWADVRGGSTELYYQKLDADGNVLIADKRIADGTANVSKFSVVIDQRDSIHLLTENVEGGARLLEYAMIDTAGEAVLDAQTIATVTSYSPFYWTAPTIAVDSQGRVHVTWLDDRDGNFEVYYKYGDVVDSDPPVITLLGDPIVTMEAGSAYVDAGATAYDEVDGDLTAAIEVDNQVNISAVGTYTITYNVTDAAGNSAAEITRTVQVVDTIAPEVSIVTDRGVLWPPNHKLVDVLVDGAATDAGSGIAFVDVSVSDEYGQFELAGYAPGQSIALEAWRRGNDKDGRVYTLTITATDKAGNVASAVADVLVPHDMGRR